LSSPQFEESGSIQTFGIGVAMTTSIAGLVRPWQ
jgi:hypothetical protein